MKVEWRTILGASLFLGATAAVYWALKNNPTESAGVAMLIFGFAAYGMLFGYLLLQYIRRDRIPRPEDNSDATMADGEGVIAYFPSASIWPAGMGVGMIMGTIGLIWGMWYLIIGALIFFGAVAGFVVESDVESEVPDTLEEEEAAEAAGHPGHLDPHIERFEYEETQPSPSPSPSASAE